jgi:hypothetical protein
MGMGTYLGHQGSKGKGRCREYRKDHLKGSRIYLGKVKGEGKGDVPWGGWESATNMSWSNKRLISLSSKSELSLGAARDFPLSGWGTLWGGGDGKGGL